MKLLIIVVFVDCSLKQIIANWVTKFKNITDTIFIKLT